LSAPTLVAAVEYAASQPGVTAGGDPLLFLSPEKLFVVLVVAVIVLGPEKLPRVARQAATTWRTLASLRTRLESQARTALASEL